MFMYSKLLKISVIKNYKILIMISKNLKNLIVKSFAASYNLFIVFELDKPKNDVKIGKIC